MPNNIIARSNIIFFIIVDIKDYELHMSRAIYEKKRYENIFAVFFVIQGLIVCCLSPFFCYLRVENRIIGE